LHQFIERQAGPAARLSTFLPVAFRGTRARNRDGNGGENPCQRARTDGKMTSPASQKVLRDAFIGFMRVHVLHHAAKEPIYGLEMIDELKRHGYAIGPGTLYPLLHSLERAGLLRSKVKLVAGKNRKYYRTTRSGDALLVKLRVQIRELVHEVVHEQ
jgi:DNA-binding PadR family transcriptional regulator